MSEQLASHIEGWIAEEQWSEGVPLIERVVAERFRVSRTPVREALQRLAEQGKIIQRPEGGFAVKARIDPPPLAPVATIFEHDADEAVYLQIAEDRLSGELPERITENELMRRYPLTRVRLGAILRRIDGEGWIERLPGKGWLFLPVLSSASAYEQGYRLRILLEPAAILEPTYRHDDALLRRCLAEQQALVGGAVEWASPAQLFDTNARLHEAIATLSGNLFVVDTLKRVNRVRRLMEYRKVVDRVAAARRCGEHLALIELLLTRQREAAAAFMGRHLQAAAREKAGLDDAPGHPVA